MQNSIWKLTALAGVIGIGFLIALQTQSSLDKDRTTAQTESAPAESTAGSNTDRASGLWQSEPEPNSAPAPRRLRSSSNDVRLTSNDDASDSTANRRADVNGFESFDGGPRRSATTAPSEFVPGGRSRAIPEFDSANDRNPFGDNSEPAVSATSRETPKAQAQRLLREAHEALDAGQLQSAYALAEQALDLPVVYGPLDERPAQLLAQIDALLKAKTKKPVAQEPLNEEPELVDPLANLKSKSPKIEDSAPPSLKSDLSDDPFKTELNEEPKAKSSGVFSELLDDEPKKPVAKKNEETLPLPDLDTEEAPERKPLTVKKDAEIPRLSLLDESEPVVEPAPLKPLKPANDEPQTKLVIRKDAPTTARLGEAMIYSMTVENRGVINAAEVTVEDTVPQGCELVGSNPQAEQTGKKLLWKLGRIEAGKSKVIKVKVIPREEGDIGTVARVISVAETSTEGIIPMSREELRPALPNGKLRLTVTAPERVRVGESATFNFKLTNPTDTTLTGINLQDIVPAGFKHPDGNDVTYPVETLAARETIEVPLELEAVRAGHYVNRAIITSGTRILTETESRIEVLDARGLRVETSDAASMPIGQPTVQEIRLINEATTAATGVVIVDTLPADLRFLKASHGGQYDAVSRKVRWNIDSIPAGETALLKLTVQPKSAGPHSCVIEVSQSNSKKQASVESSLKARGIAGLRVDLDHAEPSVLAGDEITVEVRIRNRGNGPDSNVELNLLLPTELEFVRSRGPVRNQAPQIGRAGSKLVAFDAMPEFGERADVTFEVTLRAKLPGKAKVRAEITSTEMPEAIATESVIVVLDAAP